MSNYEEEMDQITLTLEDDSELLCDVIATFPVTIKGVEQMYVALLPTDAGEDAEIFLYRFSEDGDEIDIQNIEDDEEFEIVADKFDELLDEEEFDELFDDEEEDEE
ncbi:MAG: DUF1292 domain-containing protein [Lachnospiraceae bacterium]|nr:DUF1292 domain-containing protein [Lachnospiraceae bacterium]